MVTQEWADVGGGAVGKWDMFAGADSAGRADDVGSAGSASKDVLSVGYGHDDEQKGNLNKLSRNVVSFVD